MKVNARLDCRRMIPVFPERTAARFTPVECLSCATAINRMDSAMLALIIHNQKVDVIRRHHVV
jgi:hypothetical protein